MPTRKMPKQTKRQVPIPSRSQRSYPFSEIGIKKCDPVCIRTTMVFFFSFCKRGREAFKRPAVGDIIYPLCNDVKDDSLTDDLSSCFDSSQESWLEETCRALRTNALEELEVDPDDHMIDDDNMILISRAIKDCPAVARLILRNLEKLPQKGLLDVTPVLRGCHTITSICLEDSGEDAVISVAQELARDSSNVKAFHMKGNVVCPRGAQAICELLKNSGSILQFSFCHNGITAEGVSCIFQDLGHNQLLRSLDLVGNSINDCSLSTICDALAQNHSLEFLCLDFNDFGPNGVKSIAAMMRCNSTLQELHLFGNRIDSDGAKHIARALDFNASLIKLVLSFNRIGNEGAIALAHTLTVNSSLRTLSIPSNHIDTEGMRAWGELLPQMKGLEHLNIGDIFDTGASKAILKGLERNTRLTTLYMESQGFDEPCTVDHELDYLLRFNKCGRSLIYAENDVPPMLWATALGKANENRSATGSPDVMYSILRERPDLLETRKYHPYAC